ncbi:MULTISPECIES: hypothetical protein [unclassified Pseudoxanthomonas]|uniref:DUF7014 domain-containing protein n=1 Tax=unclassified Pseudoxanthomonas TaxID=2645906 RepID=UPI003077FEA0
MALADIFKVFSRRAVSSPQTPKPLTETFRSRVFMGCRDSFAMEEFWREIHSKLAYLHGRHQLSNTETRSEVADVLAFLSGCDDAHFLDFIEYIFQTRSHFHGSGMASSLVDDINEFFRQDDLPYALTHFVWTESEEGEYVSSRLTAHPQVIRKDSAVIHATAINPALELLRGSEFLAANREFLEALEDFRKADYGDCLTKCGSAFESVLKVICVRKKWPHNATDTASPLLRTVIANAGIDSFFEQPLVLVATIRNRLSKSHGAGTASRDVTEAKAEYAINATAAAILLLVKESR